VTQHQSSNVVRDLPPDLGRDVDVLICLSLLRPAGRSASPSLRTAFNVYAARNMLADLRDREVLEKIGEARGGTGVKYGPGGKFPKKRMKK